LSCGGFHHFYVAHPPAGTGFNGTVTLNMGAITGGVTGSLSTTVISAGSPATLTLNAVYNANLGTYPILVTGIATSGTITHSVLAVLGVALGSSPGTTIQLGSISVQVGSATTPATIPPTIIVPPLPAGDSLTGCTSSPGTTAMLGTLGSTTVQTLTLSATSAVQAGTTGSFSCTTGQGRIVAAIEQYWNIAQVEVNTIPLGGGSFEIQATTNGFSEVTDVILTAYDGTGDDDSEAGTSGDVTAYFAIFLPPGGCFLGSVVAEGFGGDVDGGPAFAEGSLDVCYEPGPALPTLQILSTTSDGRTTTNVTNSNQSVLVGQYVDLTAVVMNGTGTPTFQWSQPPGNTAINWSAIADQSQGPVPINPNSFQSNNLSFAWTDTSANAQCAQPGQCVQVTATIPGSPPLSAGVQFNITTPQVMPVAQQFGTVISTSCPNRTDLAMCNYDPTANAPVGISFEPSSPGNNLIEWLQTVNSGSKWNYYGPSGTQCESNTSGRDGPGPLTFLDGPDLGDAGDAPSVPLQNGDQLITVALSFSTFFMFRPTTNDIFVPLYRIDWSWSAQAQPFANSPTGWQLSSPTSGGPTPAVVRVVDNVLPGQPSAYPKWNGQANPLAPCETVTAPATPSGAASGSVGTSYTYTTSGSTSSIPTNPVQYQFIWGDGTASPWLIPGTGGTASASHSWNGFGTYAVTAQARSAPNPSLLSPMSSALVVTIQ
jgi:hypothetical protein